MMDIIFLSDLSLKFLNTQLENTYLLYANKTLDFFYNLANSGMIGLAPFGNPAHDIFFIQLPKKRSSRKSL